MLLQLPCSATVTKALAAILVCMALWPFKVVVCDKAFAWACTCAHGLTPMPCIHARCALQCPTPLAAVMQRRRQPSRSRSQRQPLNVGRTALRRLASPLQVRWVMHSQSTSVDCSLRVNSFSKCTMLPYPALHCQRPASVFGSKVSSKNC